VWPGACGVHPVGLLDCCFNSPTGELEQTVIGLLELFQKKHLAPFLLDGKISNWNKLCLT
jgi:hypothetical protein